MVQIQAKSIKVIQLGHRGENEARQIIFDLADYISTYGPGTARLLHQRDGDPAPYIVPAVQADSTLTWTVTDEDTAAPGTGSAELQWMVDSVLAKSDIWCTKTKAALDDGAAAPPTGAEGWYQQLIAYIDSLRDEGVSEEQIAAAVEAYLLEHPVDVPVTSVNGKIGAVQLTAADVRALAQDDLQAGVDAALEQAKASGEFDGPQGPQGQQGPQGEKGDPGDTGPAGPQGEQGQKGDKGDTGDTGPQGEVGQQGPKGDTGETGPAGADGKPGTDGKSAYQYAVEGGYAGTEAEFAAKLAAEMPTTLPNPNALTFTGAVTGSYDGSEALTVNIPSGGGRDSRLICDITLSEDAYSIEITSDLDGNSFELSEVWIFYEGCCTHTKNTYLSVSSVENPSKRWIADVNGTSQSGTSRKGCVHGVLMAPGIIRGDVVTINSNSGLYPNSAYNEPVFAYEDKITSLKLFTNNTLSYAFVAGFRVRVYGR